jgi:hypothetical protein
MALVFLLAISSLTLTGCVELAANLLVGGASIASSAGGLVDTPSTDSDMTTVQLSTTSDEFVERVKAAAHDLGYQIQGVNGLTEKSRGVLLHKQSDDLGGALIGRDWQYTIAINLMENGTTQISATTQGNNHKGDPGTAKKLVDEFKTRLVAAYATR